MDSDCSPEVRFRLLGPLEVTVGGRPVHLGGIGSRCVLAMLLLASGRVVSEDALVDALWGEHPPRGARNSLQSHISRLRQRLIKAGGVELGARLRHEPGGYRLRVEIDEVDVGRVDGLLAQARAAPSDGAGRTDEVAALLAEALASWRGAPLSDLVDVPGWPTSGLAAARARFDELEVTVREELLTVRLAAGSHAAALPELEEVAAAQSLRERPQLMLALALYRCGRAPDALAALRRYRDRLVEDTGLDPSVEFRDLERAILSGDQALAAPAPAVAPAATAQAPAGPRASLARAGREAPYGEFVGRRGELERVLDLVADAEAGHGGMVLVTGEAGIGKTRLLSAVTDAAAERGALVLSGRCLDGVGTVPYHPFAVAVEEFLATGLEPPPAALPAVTALLPGRAPSIPDPSPGRALQPDELRLRLLDGVVRFLRSLSATRTLVVAIDDLQWADPSTLAMLRHIARSSRGQRLMLVGAYRSGEVADGHPLSDALAGLRSDTEYTAMRLTGLDPAALERLLRTTAGAPLAPSLVATIHAQTGGNPLFAREMARHLLEEDALRADPDGLLHTELPLRAVPESVRQVIARRRRRLSPAANRLLDAAAVVDGPFPFEPVADVAELDASSALGGLDEALAAGLVNALPSPDRYDFAHALVRHTVYTTLNPSRRLRLHRRLAEALDAARSAGSSIGPEEIAAHYHRSAALPGASSGVEPALEAAALARAAGAHDEDARLLRLACELARPHDVRQPEILTRSASALAWSLRFDEAVTAGKAAVAAVARDRGPAAGAATAADLATTLAAVGSNRHAWELVPLGLGLAGEGAEATAADSPSWAALTLLDLERREAADPDNPGILLDVPKRRSALRVLHEAGLLAGRPDLGRYAVAALYGSRDQIPPECAKDPTVALLVLGDFGTALPRFEAEAATAQADGRLLSELYCRSSIARCHTALGDLSAAVAAMRVADQLADRAAGARTSWQLTTHLGARDALAMALDTGWEPLLAATLPLLRPELPEHQWAIATLEAARGRAHARLGNTEAALRLLDRPVRALQQAPAWAPNYLRTACDAAESLWLLDTREHLAAVEEALQRAARADFRFPMMDARLALARLCALDERQDEARRWFAASRTALEGQSARPLRAVVDHDEALMHTKCGDHAAAAPLTAAAADAFRTLGMTGWAQRLSRWVLV